MILEARSGRTAIITINRPERRNALNFDAVVALDDAVASAMADEVRAIVFTGTDGHFCAGADLKDLEDLAFTKRLRVMLSNVANVSVPTIAAISGSCIGLGMQLSLGCDMRFATPDANCAIPVAKLGLMIDHWSLQRLVRAVGTGTARYMALSAQFLPAETMLARGFLQEVIDGDVLAYAMEVADRIATLAPLAISGTKLGMNLIEPTLSEPAFEAAFVRAWESDDLVEGRAAFVERRPAKFKGR